MVRRYGQASLLSATLKEGAQGATFVTFWGRVKTLDQLFTVISEVFHCDKSE